MSDDVGDGLGIGTAVSQYVGLSRRKQAMYEGRGMVCDQADGVGGKPRAASGEVSQKREPGEPRGLGPSLGIVPLTLLNYAEMVSSFDVDFRKAMVYGSRR